MHSFAILLCALALSLGACARTPAAAPAASTPPAAAPAAPSAPAAPTVSAPAPRAGSAFCPREARDWFWAHEVFPTCVVEPYWWSAVPCNGDCPRPCRRMAAGDSHAPIINQFITDDAGRWVASTQNQVLGGSGDRAGPGSSVNLVTCRRQGRDATCEGRSSRGRPEEVGTLKYDEQGNLVTVRSRLHRDATLEYSAGRLTTVRERDRRDEEITTTFAYDARGRLSRSTQTTGDGPNVTSYTYDDATDWLVQVDEVGLLTVQTTYTYDAQGRVVQTTLATIPASGTATRWETALSYDCPAAQPFADAVARLEAYRASACGCRDVQCAVRIADEVERWRRGVHDLSSYAPGPTVDEYKAFRATLDQLGACVWAAAGKVRQ